jgi:membrane protease YdiL (CAAX protease family)
MLVAGALYLGAIVFRDWILGVFGIPSQVSPDYLRHFGGVHVVASLALRVPAIAVIGIIWVRCPKSRFRASLKMESARVVTRTVVVTVALSFVLNLFGVWPFMWRWASDSTSAYVGVLVSTGQSLAILLWILTAVVVGPVLEELVFRFGVLQAVRDWTGSRAKAVIISSAIFALGHLGYLPPDFPHIANASWLFAASLVLGSITLGRAGRIGVSLAAHAARNALEVSLLFLLARPGAG